MIAEESVSIRAVKRVYAELSGVKEKSLTPKDIFDIAEGIKEGDRQAAVASFGEMGEMAGSAIASALNIVDGLVVIGGGLAGASRYILPALIAELRCSLEKLSLVYKWMFIIGKMRLRERIFLLLAIGRYTFPVRKLRFLIIIRNELPYCVVGKEQAALSCVGLMHMHCNQ